MKKTSVMCMMVVCLATQGFSSRVVTELDLYLATPEQEVEGLQRVLKDPAKLRECMVRITSSLNPTSYTRIDEFKQRFAVSDKAMQTALLDIIREASAKTGWKRSQLGDALDIRIADMQLIPWSIRCLKLCADAEGKKFLMGIATDAEKDSDFRWTAISSYLIRADAQETQETLTRFLVGDMRATLTLPYHGLYSTAILMYDDAEHSPQKHKAIADALTAALAQEKEKEAFTWADKNLAERSKEYAESPQRKAALERMSKPPDKD